jgi:hypothetical protein
VIKDQISTNALPRARVGRARMISVFVRRDGLNGEPTLKNQFEKSSYCTRVSQATALVNEESLGLKFLSFEAVRDQGNKFYDPCARCMTATRRALVRPDNMNMRKPKTTFLPLLTVDGTSITVSQTKIT